MPSGWETKEPLCVPLAGEGIAARDWSNRCAGSDTEPQDQEPKVLYEFLAVNIHEQNIREGVARQQTRDLVKAFRRSASRMRRSRLETSIESQPLEHAVPMNIQQAGW